MKSRSSVHRVAEILSVLLASSAFSAAALAAGPKVVSGPNADPQCFVPWSDTTKLLQYPAKRGPYRIALANGYIANTWRIQMIRTAKAYAISSIRVTTRSW
jgi:ribose transport system substrate-binding protein